MRSLGGREKVILVVCVAVVAVYALAQGVIKPLQESRTDIILQRELLERELNLSRQVLKKSRALEVQYAQLKAVFGVVSNASKEDAVMISRAEAAAVAAGVHIVNMRPLPVIKKDIENIFSVEISFDGSRKAISEFFYLAQNQEKLFKLEEMNLENYSNSPGMLRGRAVFSRIRLLNSF
jgi:hypothetical protein